MKPQIARYRETLEVFEKFLVERAYFLCENLFKIRKIFILRTDARMGVFYWLKSIEQNGDESDYRNFSCYSLNIDVFRNVRYMSRVLARAHFLSISLSDRLVANMKSPSLVTKLGISTSRDILEIF